MKTSQFWLFILAGTICLSGCSAFENDGFLTQIYLELTGINSTEEYQQYQNLAKENLLTEDGYYNLTDLKESEGTGSVIVSLASNRFLDITYYYDESLTQPILSKTVLMNPGDSVYVGEAITADSATNLYKLSNFEIYKVDESGEYRDKLFEGLADNKLLYTIPDDISDEGIVIIPKGKYENEEITMKAYTVGINGKETLLTQAGNWEAKINNKPQTFNEKSKTISWSVSPIKPFTLEYLYNSKEYFYVRAYPEPLYAEDDYDNENGTGIVKFRKSDIATQTTEYKVELHQYLSLTLKCPAKAEVTILNETGEIIQDAKELKKGNREFNDLKFGYTFLIESSESPEIITENDYSVDVNEDILKDGTYQISVKILEQGAENNALEEKNGVLVKSPFELNLPSSGEYGNFIYKLDGKELSGSASVLAGQELSVTYYLTDDSVQFNEGHGGLFGGFQDWINKRERTKTITITETMKSEGLDVDRLFSLTKNGE